MNGVIKNRGCYKRINISTTLTAWWEFLKITRSSLIPRSGWPSCLFSSGFCVSLCCLRPVSWFSVVELWCPGLINQYTKDTHIPNRRHIYSYRAAENISNRRDKLWLQYRTRITLWLEGRFCWLWLLAFSVAVLNDVHKYQCTTV